MPDTLLHICENCGAEKAMTPEEAFHAGWDYPPRLGAFGVISPRTCGNCGVDTTLWWRMVVQKIDPSELTEQDLALIQRIEAEPDSLRVEESEKEST